MASRRKVSHHNEIKGKTAVFLNSVDIGDIIEFKYSGKNIYDNKPMVFVLAKFGKYLEGININYMKEYKVQQLLQEKSYNKMKWYELYEDSFRTYLKSKMLMIKKITYGKDPDAT